MESRLRLTETRAIDREYLVKNWWKIFIFEDDFRSRGKRGKVKHTIAPNTWGFIVQKTPGLDSSFEAFSIEEYWPVYQREIQKLQTIISLSPSTDQFFIPALGSGRANRFGIWDKVISGRIKEDLQGFDNVVFLW